jgi:hypothetical protein
MYAAADPAISDKTATDTINPAIPTGKRTVNLPDLHESVLIHDIKGCQNLPVKASYWKRNRGSRIFRRGPDKSSG